MITQQQGAVSNTARKFPNSAGLDLEISIDWLQGTGKLPPGSSLREFLDFLRAVLDDEWSLDYERAFNPGRPFKHSGSTCNGCRIAWNEIYDVSDNSITIDYWLSIPGSMLSGLNLISDSEFSIAHLVASLRDVFNFRATRIDISMDDYGKIISPLEVAEIALKPRDENGRMPHVTGVHDVRVQHSNSKKTPGVTVYFGSPKGEKTVRFYDKESQSQGEKKCYRWELQLRGFKAATLFLESAKVSQEIIHELPRFLASYVVGAIDFVERHEKNLSRCKRLGFWQLFIDAIEMALRIPVPKRTHSIEKKLEWLEHSVAKSLAIVSDVFGELPAKHIFMNLCKAGKRRFTQADDALVRSSSAFYRSVSKIPVTTF